TASSQSNSCSGTDDDDVWFSFVATATAHKIELLNVTGSTSDLYHVVYGGTCGALGSSLVCSDPNNSVVSGLTIGNTYYIRVYSWTSTTGQTTSFNVCVSTIPPPPANDACSGAIPITVSTSTTSCTNTTVNTFGATTESYNSSFWSSSYDDGVWYSFVAGASGARITGSNFSPSGTIGWSVFNGSCGSLIEIAQNGLNSNAPIWGLTVGQTYYICAFYNGTGTTGTFDMCVVNTTALGEEEIDANGFSLYPNPTTGTFTLNSAENLNNATVTVFDIKGQVVYSVVNSVSNKVEIDLSANTNGIYYVQISNNDNVITKKIVKQ
ncbi:MAG: T9SS type A sorting domain-containing protein, partial [Bacteroidetes bacterium]|nr:T9SS type A sorting domain-containing protein [Bacteroidota bacterium]